MAIEAAVNGLRRWCPRSEILAAEELRDGRLVAPFDKPEFHIEATSYFLVKSPGYRNANHVAAFEKWLRGRDCNSESNDQDRVVLCAPMARCAMAECARTALSVARQTEIRSVDVRRAP